MPSHTHSANAAQPAFPVPDWSLAEHLFFVTGNAAADFLARVLNPFMKTGLAPYRVYASRENGAGDEMTVELRFSGLAPDQPERLAAACRSLCEVRSVFVVAKP